MVVDADASCTMLTMTHNDDDDVINPFNLVLLPFPSFISILLLLLNEE